MPKKPLYPSFSKSHSYFINFYPFNFQNKKNCNSYYITTLRYFAIKKPGPKDGWNGITLKILNYIAKRNGASVKDLCSVFNLARKNIYYHLNKLIKLGIISRWPPNAKKHNPFVIYVINSFCRLESVPKNTIYSSIPFNGAANNNNRKARAITIYSQILKQLSIKPTTTGKLSLILNIPKRTIRYYISKLIKAGIIIRAGGNNCRYAHLVLFPKPANLYHKHKYTRYHKRYRK
jgi:predicted transcriptional regulator